MTMNTDIRMVCDFVMDEAASRLQRMKDAREAWRDAVCEFVDTASLRFNEIQDSYAVLEGHADFVEAAKRLEEFEPLAQAATRLLNGEEE